MQAGPMPVCAYTLHIPTYTPLSNPPNLSQLTTRLPCRDMEQQAQRQHQEVQQQRQQRKAEHSAKLQRLAALLTAAHQVGGAEW